MLKKKRWSLVSGVALLVVAFVPFGFAQDEKQKEEKIFANIAGGGTRALEVVISQSSTKSQRARLLGALDSEGQEAMMKILQDLPRVGSVRVQGGAYASTALRYAYETKTKDGKRHIIALTPRPVSLSEARSQDTSLDYDLTVIELFLPEKGKGDGAMVAGAKVRIDDETGRIKIEAFQANPTKLVNVYTK